VEILIGIVIAIYWIVRDRRYDRYEREDWDEITKHIVKKLK
jgi:hypothetical protein